MSTTTTTDDRMVETARRAIDAARAAWQEEHGRLPSNPMSRAAAIPATGIIAAALMERGDDADEDLTELARRAIRLARQAWQQGQPQSPGNPIAATAEKSVIGIIAAGILNRERAEP